MKKFKKLLMTLMFVVLATTTVSCGSFFDESDEYLKISSFEVKEIDGENVLVITYADEEKEDTIIKMPKNEPGNGISSVSSKLSEDGKKTEVTIKYTNEGVEDSIIYIPNGVSVEEISYETKEGITKMYVYYSDGRVDEYPVIKGEDGEDGMGIKKIEHIVNPDLSVSLTIYYTDETSYALTIPAPQQGEDGKGIAAMGVSENEKEYIISIAYSDGTAEEFPLTKPTISAWHKVTEKPLESYGSDGDFAFDENNLIIYSKTGGSWLKIVDFSSSVEKHSITFNLNGEGAKMPSGYPLQYTAIQGTYFSTTGNGNPESIPVPTRAGYEFAGWYTTAYPNEYINDRFTDLTPIMADLYLYAKWVEINE